MFEWDEEEQRWNAAHHPFTSVHDEDLDKLTTDPARCRAKSYDMVLNGYGAGVGLHSYSSARRAGEGFRGAGFSPTRKPNAVSDFCWKRWNTARRRTAESRWVWTAGDDSWPAKLPFAK
jgi:hypothetical protein